MQGCGAGFLQQHHSSGEEPNLACGFLPPSPLDPAAALGFASEEEESCLFLPCSSPGGDAPTALLGSAGLSCCKLFFETVPSLPSQQQAWGCSGGCGVCAGRPQHSMSWCQHCPPLKAPAGLKLRRLSRSLAPGTAWYCAKRKVKTVNNNPPSANHRLMGGADFVELLCTGEGANLLRSVPGSPWLCWCS